MKTRLYAAVLFLFSVFLIGLLHFAEKTEQTSLAGSASWFTISQDSGFYDTDLSIQITAPDGKDIYYTTDCSTPVPGASDTLLYADPVQIPCTDETLVHTLKFIICPSEQEQDNKISFFTFKDDETESETAEAPLVHTCTYIVGTDVMTRFDTLVVSLSGEEEDLFGYESGIFSAGRLRQEYLASSSETEEPFFSAPANYNIRGEKGEKAVTLHIFDQHGQTVLSQNCGIRIHGHTTRENSQKSFQLFARHQYDIYGNFHGDLFPELRTETGGTMLSRSNRLLFRNSGQDFNHGFIRDTLVQTLAYQYGYPFITPDKPAAVFINGSYSGFYWFREPFNSGCLENLYGDFPGEFITLSLDEYNTTIKEEEDPDKEKELTPYSEEFQAIYDTFRDASFSDQEVFEEFSSLIDVENYLQYYAIETYIGNKDWPYSNVKVYRYVSPDEVYTEDSVFDGRYRYLLFDSDYSFYLEDLYTGYAWDEDNIAVMSTNGHSPLWSGLMSRPDCRNRFIRYLCDVMNDAFSYEVIEETLSRLHQDRASELSYFLEHSESSDISATMHTVDEEIDTILEFAENRPEAMHNFIKNDFPVFYPYTVSVSLPQFASLALNSLSDVEDGFSGTYYAESGLDLKATPDMGHSFSHYIINGEIFTDPELTLTYEDMERLLQIPSAPAGENISPENAGSESADTAGYYLTALDIQVVITDNKYAVPLISRIHYQNPDETVELCNPCEHALSLDGFYLSSDSENLKSMKLPSITLQSGESFLLYGKKNASEEASGQYRLNFSLRKDETLYLSDQDGNIIQQVLIPDIDHPENDYALDLYSGKFYEVDSMIP